MKRFIAILVGLVLTCVLVTQAGAAFDKVGYYATPYREEENNFPTKKYTKLGWFWVTGYDTCADCCGKSDGITASGTQATTGRTCAATLPFGTRLLICGLGYRTVEDRGVGDGCIDVVCNDHAGCYALTGWYEVWEVSE